MKKENNNDLPHLNFNTIISDENKKRFLHGLKMGKKRNAILRKDGRWQVYIQINGKRKAIYGRTEYLANLQADIKEAEYNHDYKIIDKLSGESKWIFCNCFFRHRNYLLYHTNLTWGTVDRYELTYNRYIPGSIIENSDIRELDSEIIFNFISSIYMKNGVMTAKEYGRVRHIVKSTIDFCFDEELDEEDIKSMNSINWRKINRRSKEKGYIFNSVKIQESIPSDERLLLEEKVIKDNIYPEKYAHILLLLINFSLGLRVGELAALTEDCIDLNNKVVYVRETVKTQRKRDENGNLCGGNDCICGKTKTSKGIRTIPLSYHAEELFRILFQYRKSKGYTYKYLAYDGFPEKNRSKSLEKTLKHFLEISNTEKFSTHIIRKSFATALSMCPDIDMATISRYMGHAQVSTTINNYIIPTRNSLDKQRYTISKYI